MYFLIKGEPKPKQSARFRIAKSGDKSFIMSYQKKAVKQAESDIISQILGGFCPPTPSNFIRYQPDPQKAHPWSRPRRLVYNMRGSSPGATCARA